MAHPNSVKLLTREEIQRRLSRMVGESYVRRPTEITRFDVARWFSITLRMVREHQSGKLEITDFWQFAYSQLFAWIDAGEVVLGFDERGKKVLKRVPKPDTPVKKTPQPYVNFATMKLGFD